MSSLSFTALAHISTPPAIIHTRWLKCVFFPSGTLHFEGTCEKIHCRDSGKLFISLFIWIYKSLKTKDMTWTSKPDLIAILFALCWRDNSVWKFVNTWWLLQELKRFPSLQADIAAASNESLEKFRDESRKTVNRLVEMESTYLTVEFFRKIHEADKNPRDDKHSNRSGPNTADRYEDNHFRRIGRYYLLLSFLCCWY